MNWQICDPQPEHLDDLRRLYLQTRKQAFTWLDVSTFTLEEFDSATQDEGILVAVSAGKPIGFVSWWLPANFIHNLYVDSDFLRQGVGNALLNGCLGKIGRPATLKCLRQNGNAVSFYLTQGWHIKTEEPSEEGAYYLMEFTQ